MTITKELVKELLEAEEKATPGEWEFNASSTTSSRIWLSSLDAALYLMCEKNKSIVHDTKFIAIARNNLRALCESWLKQQEEIDSWRSKALDCEKHPVVQKLIQERDQAQDALEMVCDALFSTKALAVISTAKEEGSSVVKEWANELDYTRHTLMSDLIIQDARKKK